MSYLSSFRTSLQCLLFASFFGVFSGVAPAAEKQTTETQPVVEQSWVLTQILQLQDRSAKLEVLLQQQSLRSNDVKDAEKELQQIQLQLVEFKEKLTAHEVGQSKELADLSSRISDISFYTNIWGGILAVFGLIITIAAIAMGWSAKNRAVSEATKAANEYFDSQGKPLIEAEQAKFEAVREKEINELRQKHEALQKELKSQSDQLIAHAFLSKAEAFEKDENPEAVTAEYDQLVARFKDSQSVEIKEKVALALFRKARVLTQFERLEDANLAYDELVGLYIGEHHPKIMDLVVKGLANKGMSQGKLGQKEAAVETYEKLVTHFGGVAEPGLKLVIATALQNKGAALGRLNKAEAAINAFSDVVQQFGNETELRFKEQVARALLNMALAQAQLNQLSVAEETYSRLIDRFIDSTESELRYVVAQALTQKGSVQREQGKLKSAMKTLKAMLNRFGDAKEPLIKELVALAHSSLGFGLVCGGKKELNEEHLEQAKNDFKQALEHFDTALTYHQPEQLNGIILGNRAYVLALLGDIEQAELVFAKALRAPTDSGRSLYEATLKDFDIHPVVQDQPMKELVERQWKLWLEEQQTEPEESAA